MASASYDFAIFIAFVNNVSKENIITEERCKFQTISRSIYYQRYYSLPLFLFNKLAFSFKQLN